MTTDTQNLIAQVHALETSLQQINPSNNVDFAKLQTFQNTLNTLRTSIADLVSSQTAPTTGTGSNTDTGSGTGANTGITPVYRLSAPEVFDGNPRDSDTTINIVGAQPRLAVVRGHALYKSGSGGAVAFSWGFTDQDRLFAIEMGGFADKLPSIVVWDGELWDRSLRLNPVPDTGDYVVAGWYDGTTLYGSLNGGAPFSLPVKLDTQLSILRLGSHPHMTGAVSLSEVEIYDTYSDALRDSVITRMMQSISITNPTPDPTPDPTPNPTPTPDPTPNPTPPPTTTTPSNSNLVSGYSDSGCSLQLLTPVGTSPATHNQYPDEQIWACGVAVADHSINAGVLHFSGTSKGLKNIIVVVAGGWHPTTIEANGNFAVDIDCSNLPSGPNTVFLYGWDSLPNQAYTVTINGRFDLWIRSNITTPNVVPDVAKSMRLVFEDNFDAPLDTSKWFCGSKPDGGQWGGAHFVSANESQFNNVYHVQEGFLRIRANHDVNYVDPEAWGWKEPGAANPIPADQPWKNGRNWYSGQMSTAFPDGHSTGSARRGYFEVRAKAPNNPGAWSAPVWLLNVPSIKDQPGRSVEIDVECYGAFPKNWNPTIHFWRPDSDGGHIYETGVINAVDITTDFHLYGILITDNEVVWYFDNVEVFRKPLYRANDASLGKFFALIDLSLSYDWPVQPPPAQYIDLFVDYIRIYSAD
jgi:beta-glucanase (GH16 family)